MEIQLMGELGHANEKAQKLRNLRGLERIYKRVYSVKTSEDQAVRLIFSAKNLSDENILSNKGNAVFFHTIKDPREVKREINGTIICETEGADDKIKRFANLKDFFAARKEFLSRNSAETKNFWHNLLCSTSLYYSAQKANITRTFDEERYVVRYVAHKIFSSFTEALADFRPEERKNALEVFVAGSNLALQEIKFYCGDCNTWAQDILQFPNEEKIFPPEIQYNYANNFEEAFILREKKTSLDRHPQPSSTVAVATGHDQTKTSSDNARQEGMSVGDG